MCQSLWMALPHRIRQQAGSYSIGGVLSPQNDADSVGDVRGYEGMGRNSDECGVSATVDGADPPHPPSRHEVVVRSGLLD